MTISGKSCKTNNKELVIFEYPGILESTKFTSFHEEKATLKEDNFKQIESVDPIQNKLADIF